MMAPFVFCRHFHSKSGVFIQIMYINEYNIPMFKEEVIGGPEVSAVELNKNKNRRWRTFFSRLWTVFLVVAVIIVIPVAYVDIVYTEVYIDGASMEPTFNSGANFLNLPALTNGQSYVEVGLMNPSNDAKKRIDRGHIIIFDNTPQSDTPNLLIKRVIGLPGEELLITDNGNASDTIKITTADGSIIPVLSEDYLTEEHQYLTLTNNQEINITLSDDEYFVMGDNRDNSTDSRVFGAINKTQLEGKLWMINGYGIKENGKQGLTGRKYYAFWNWRYY